MTPISNVTLSVNGEETPLTEFIKRYALDSYELSVEELAHVLQLKVNKDTCIGLMDVQRIK